MKINFPTLLILSALSLCAVMYLAGAPLFTPSVTIMGILFLVAVSLSTYSLAARSVNDPNPNKFVRMVMATTMIKFFICVLGAGAMILILRKNLHKPDLYLLMGIYLVYSIMESIFLSQLARKNKAN
jgi:hypothetical protein